MSNRSLTRITTFTDYTVPNDPTSILGVKFGVYADLESESLTLYIKENDNANVPLSALYYEFPDFGEYFNFDFVVSIVKNYFEDDKFGNLSKDIYKKYVDSYRYFKGRLGERIAEKIYKTAGWKVEEYANNRKGIVDFRVILPDDDQTFFVEVKLRNIWKYKSNLVFSLKNSELDKYIQFNKATDTEILISLIDQESEKIYNCPLSIILKSSMSNSFKNDEVIVPLECFCSLPIPPKDTKKLRRIEISSNNVHIKPKE